MSIKRNELAGMVEPYISIDEYEPKTGTQQEIIVVAFSCLDDAPAKDLSQFIERGFIDTIDTEVAQHPNENGKYLVFVEIMRDDRFFNKFFQLIKDIENITSEMDWKIKPYLSEDTFDIKDRNFKKFVITDKKAYKSKAEFKDMLEQIKMVEELMSIKFNDTEFNIGHFDYIVEDCGSKSIFKKYNERLRPLYESASVKVLENKCGGFWDIIPTDNYIFISHKNKDLAMVLSK